MGKIHCEQEIQENITQIPSVAKTEVLDIGVSVLHTVKKAPTKFQSALFILHSLPVVSAIRCAHTSWRKFPKYKLGRGMRPHTKYTKCQLTSPCYEGLDIE